MVDFDEDDDSDQTSEDSWDLTVPGPLPRLAEEKESLPRMEDVLLQFYEAHKPEVATAAQVTRTIKYFTDMYATSGTRPVPWQQDMVISLGTWHQDCW
eukprot:SAG31_NODE_12013_length_978_cov_0.802048_2_plen_98_part_00